MAFFPMSDSSEDLLTRQIIGCAIEIHRELGPGLLESSYEEALCHEFESVGIGYGRQLILPLHYKGQSLDCGYRIDLIVENRVIVEIKAVEKTLPIHDAQLMTYLRLAHKKTGLLINFNVCQLREGVRRLSL